MLTFTLIFFLGLIPIGLYYFRQYKIANPKMQWPVLAPLLNLQYEGNPPRMSGQWNGRMVKIETHGAEQAEQEVVKISLFLAKPSRLRVEIGPREEVAQRAGLVVPDPVTTGDENFDRKFLARCNNKATGLEILDAIMRERILLQERVDILGEGNSIRWIVPHAKDPDTLETMLETLTVIATEMERFF
ncbi:MAG: hypothetical protein A3J74_10715 [Elusimicrobia bacterium RIFCSPHIGHO2_02_FULL_57_9]|nr:MAG: hypothetical protein A3J74_10715 [Elusimicrobia bacterium RIFCSPHIGHO2_02_FULL_57_9]